MSNETLYQHGTAKMVEIIDVMLHLSKDSNEFTTPREEHWRNRSHSAILLCGKGHSLADIPEDPKQRARVWLSRSAIPFDIERAATGLLYEKLKFFSDKLISYAYSETESFSSVDEDWFNKNPQCLPVAIHALGIFSKRDFNKVLGQGIASDTSISRPISKKISKLFLDFRPEDVPAKKQIMERIKATTEGIVRDLVGRLLLEEFVSEALKKESVPFLREDSYDNLAGVVYDFRADFVIPDNVAPKAFIEVRKSSSGHASLYAKDKMFSAINWKGRHPELLGIIIVDGPWTIATLETMGKVFDYVIPLSKANEAAQNIKRYINGDDSVLRWLIQFKIISTDDVG